MTEAEILAQVSDIIRDVVDDPDIAIDMNTTAGDVEGWDSMAHINIVVATEAGFGVKFNTSELEDAKNVGDLVRLIEARKK